MRNEETAGTLDLRDLAQEVAGSESPEDDAYQLVGRCHEVIASEFRRGEARSEVAETLFFVLSAQLEAIEEGGGKASAELVVGIRTTCEALVLTEPTSRAEIEFAQRLRSEHPEAFE